MQLIEVNDKTGVTLFHEVALQLYADDQNYVFPLRMEIEGVFDPVKNGILRHGEAIRWVLLGGKGELLGRIAAFVDNRKLRNEDPKPGGMGFFMCVDDIEVAAVLFDAAADWLQLRGCQVMDGSINFGENFVNWGVLIHGFIQQGYGMPYNKPYYKDLFLSYGFQEYFLQYGYHVDLKKSFPERMLKFARYLETRPGYTFKPFSRKKGDQFFHDFTTILNRTWGDYMEDFEPIQDQEIKELFDSAKSILVDDFIWFAYKDGEPIALTVAFPDVNQALVNFKGKLNFIQGLKFLYLQRNKTITRNRVLLAGVVPEYQNSGMIAALFLQFVKAVQKRKEYTEMEFSWVGDFNPRMRKIYEQIGGVHATTHATYRFVLDKAVVFERFTNEQGNSQLRKDVKKRE